MLVVLFVLIVLRSSGVYIYNEIRLCTMDLEATELLRFCHLPRHYYFEYDPCEGVKLILHHSQQT